MTNPAQPKHFDLTLDHLLTAAGIEDNAAVLLVRHTYKPDGLRGPADMTLNKVLAYTREQRRKGKVPANPPSLWLTFIADGGRRSRFVTAYENFGVVDAPDHIPWKRAQAHRWFDLRQSELLTSLRDRLVIEWTSDTINWAKSGRSAEAMRVVEIADPEAVPFPGYDRFVVDYPTLQAAVDDSRYASWRTALAAVQGIYLIADKKTGKLYVGKADGSERFLGRWASYTRDGHGGNVLLKELATTDANHSQDFVFSILRVFDPTTPTAEVDAAESHYKEALLTRLHGYNKN
ncbi:GIY-YIG nuclease family protein [Nocardioides sp. NPDC004968]|uniref:GIY-YIG nuclease family protein n=1 Tax=Nocardioides sp. NPDC004968 TaxID=3155894 RepID=UPI0033BAC316